MQLSLLFIVKRIWRNFSHSFNKMVEDWLMVSRLVESFKMIHPSERKLNCLQQLYYARNPVLLAYKLECCSASILAEFTLVTAAKLR